MVCTPLSLSYDHAGHSLPHMYTHMYTKVTPLPLLLTPCYLTFQLRLCLLQFTFGLHQ